MARAEAAERLIRRYDNRKLYDARARAYVTLSGLAALVSEGHDVRVVDQKTGDDITTTVLAQAILEALKERTLRLPRQVLVHLIRLGMRPALEPAAAAAERPDVLQQAKQEAEKIVAGLLQRGRLPLEEALQLRQEIAASLRERARDLERGVESRLKGVLGWLEHDAPAPRAKAKATKKRTRR